MPFSTDADVDRVGLFKISVTFISLSLILIIGFKKYSVLFQNYNQLTVTSGKNGYNFNKFL